MNAALLYQQAVRFHTQGALGQAEQLYLQIIQTHQDSFSARHALGVEAVVLAAADGVAEPDGDGATGARARPRHS